MIISIAIGSYLDKPNEDDTQRVGGYFRDLDGIYNDNKNMVKLFQDKLYSITQIRNSRYWQHKATLDKTGNYGFIEWSTKDFTK